MELQAEVPWYPPKWKCPHGVNLLKWRCMKCDREIDWKKLAAEKRAPSAGAKSE